MTCEVGAEGHSVHQAMLQVSHTVRHFSESALMLGRELAIVKLTD